MNGLSYNIIYTVYIYIYVIFTNNITLILSTFITINVAIESIEIQGFGDPRDPRDPSDPKSRFAELGRGSVDLPRRRPTPLPAQLVPGVVTKWLITYTTIEKYIYIYKNR